MRSLRLAPWSASARRTYLETDSMQFIGYSPEAPVLIRTGGARRIMGSLANSHNLRKPARNWEDLHGPAISPRHLMMIHRLKKLGRNGDRTIWNTNSPPRRTHGTRLGRMMSTNRRYAGRPSRCTTGVATCRRR